jgi:hypothetical protein
MDERFVGYGWEDTDYSQRVLQLKLKLGITGDVVVTHGLEGHPFQSTFGELYDGAELAQMNKRARKQYIDKWGTPGPILF